MKPKVPLLIKTNIVVHHVNQKAVNTKYSSALLSGTIFNPPPSALHLPGPGGTLPLLPEALALESGALQLGLQRGHAGHQLPQLPAGPGLGAGGQRV